MVALSPSTSDPRTDVDLIVSAVAVPVLVADYTPLIQRFAGMPVAQMERELRSDENALMECLSLPRTVAVSHEWARLYGSPRTDDAPDLPTRQFTAELYPDLHESLVRQFTAPLRGVTSIVREHAAPTMYGDVIVRSHWKASKVDERPAYERVVVVDLDVTDIRRVQRSLEEALESKDRFIATVGHELKNPITSLVGFGSLLNTDWDQLEEEDRREMVSMVADQARDVAELLDDLLASAVGDSLKVAREVVSIGETLTSLDLTDVECRFDPELRFVGDKMRVRQVLRNLVQNARRHGGPYQALAVEKAWPNIAIQVSDDGNGVSDEMTERLFEPYSHDGGSESVGLGLSVSKKLARAMGGDITYQRDNDRTVFSLVLPAA